MYNCWGIDESWPRKIILFSEDLLSKFGFGDGDMMTQLDIYEDRHEELIDLVEEYLIPEIKKYHTIETYTLPTNHNPIRIRIIDGIESDDYSEVEIAEKVNLRPLGVELTIGSVGLEVIECRVLEQDE